MMEDIFLQTLEKGSELIEQGELENARKTLDRAVALKPDDAKARDLLGLACFKLGDYKAAELIYQALVDENIDDPTLRVNLGLVFLKTGRFQEAIRELDTAVGLQPDHARAQNYLGLAYARVGNYSRAKGCFLAAGAKDMADKMDQYVESASSQESSSLNRKEDEEKKKEAERLEAERLEAERLEAERLEAEKKEAERLEEEKKEAERLEAEKREAERLEAEKKEAERLEAEKKEAERLEAEKKEAERLEAEKREAERLEAEKKEAERLEAEKKEAERLEKEQKEADISDEERKKEEKLEIERKEAELMMDFFAGRGSGKDISPDDSSAPGKEGGYFDAPEDPFPVGKETSLVNPDELSRAFPEDESGGAAPKIPMQESAPFPEKEGTEKKSVSVDERKELFGDPESDEDLADEESFYFERSGTTESPESSEPAWATSDDIEEVQLPGHEKLSGVDLKEAQDLSSEAFASTEHIHKDAKDEKKTEISTVHAAGEESYPGVGEAVDGSLTGESVAESEGKVHQWGAISEEAAPDLTDTISMGLLGDPHGKDSAFTNVSSEIFSGLTERFGKWILPRAIPDLYENCMLPAGGIGSRFAVSGELVMIEVENGVFSRLRGMVAMSGDMGISPEVKRFGGRVTEKPFGEGENRFFLVRGRGLVYLSRLGRHFTPMILDEDMDAYVSENSLFGFDDSIAFENGRVPSNVSADLHLVHLSGRGAILIDSFGPLVSVAVNEDSPLKVPVQNMIGWTGQITPAIISLSDEGGAADGPLTGLELAGEGVVFLSLPDPNIVG